MNVARIASLPAGLPVEASARTINRFCSSGLQAIAMAAERIMSGRAEVTVASGTYAMPTMATGRGDISPHVRTAGRGTSSVGRARAGPGHRAPGTLRLVRDSWIQAGRDAARPGVRRCGCAEDGGPEAFRHRRDRVERSLRCTVAG